MNWGGWSIERELFDRMVGEIPKDGVVVELGSGASSRELSSKFKLVSYEHDPLYLSGGDPPRWVVHHAPLVAEWYDPRVVSATIPRKYDALLIDGPPTGDRRLNMLRHLSLFCWDALVIIDDLHRKEEKALASALEKHIGRELKTVRCKEKSFGII